jgi:hypothetical protein
MATSKYFNNYSPSVVNEQRLMEDLIVETIKQRGHDVYYMPRESYGDTDEIWGERPDTKFSRAYMVEMYIQTTQQFAGQQEINSKFGLENRDDATFVVSRRSFERFIPASVMLHPREGDLIYVPLMQAFFEIKFVEEEKEFFSMGKRYPFSYYLSTERFRASNENFDTGVEEIDDLEETVSYTIQLQLGSGSGNYTEGEFVYQGANLAISSASAEVKDWDHANNKLQIINIKSTFSNGVQVVGASSNTSRLLVSSRDQGDFEKYDDFENELFQEGADNIIDTSEINPFGVP